MGELVNFATARAERAGHPSTTELVDPDRVMVVIPAPALDYVLSTIDALFAELQVLANARIPLGNAVTQVSRVHAASAALLASAEYTELIGSTDVDA